MLQKRRQVSAVSLKSNSKRILYIFESSCRARTGALTAPIGTPEKTIHIRYT